METTPFGVEARSVAGQKPVEYVVVNLWTGRQYGSFATRDEAEREAERIKRERG